MTRGSEILKIIKNIDTIELQPRLKLNPNQDQVSCNPEPEFYDAKHLSIVLDFRVNSTKRPICCNQILIKRYRSRS